MSQTDVTGWQQITTKHILSNISESKDTQAMKFNRLTDHNMRNISFQKLSKDEAERLVPDLFLCFKKTACKVKANGQNISFKTFW